MIHSTVRIGENTRVSENSVVEENCKIGHDSFVGHFVVMRPETIIGHRTLIGHGTVFEGWTTVGNDCVIHAQCHMTKGLKIGNKVFIGPMVASANDHKMCHARENLKFEPDACIIEDFVRVGTGVILLPGVVIGENAVIGAGSIVNKDIPPASMAFGSPARVVGKVPRCEWLS